MTTKIIITNLAALKRKYGAALSQIRDAINGLIKADASRGIKTSLIDVSSARAMKRIKAKSVSSADNAKQNKDAVDAIYRKYAPEYLLLLGAIDVIPHQDLRNPVHDGDDPDEFAYGDLPYACEARYSQEIKDFVGPTRVVGRLPDITGSKDPAYLMSLLEVATRWGSRPFSDYASYLGISAEVWKGSTNLTLQKLFGSAEEAQLSPPEGPQWKAALLSRRSHFINCHGAPADPRFYGQHGSSYPIAHDAVYLGGNITEGTVAAVECCYGAELYRPSLAGNQSGIGNTYLANKAYGYLGSTTIAYGPEEGNGAADLICQYFLKRVFAGASLGRAALEARQEFAQGAPELNPVDEKTLAQFNLLGDPSIHPVSKSTPELTVPRGKAFRGVSSEVASQAAARVDRRRQLIAKGLWIANTQPVARRMKAPALSRSVKSTLQNIAAQLNLRAPKILSFAIETPSSTIARTVTALTKMHRPSAFHVVTAKKSGTSDTSPSIAVVVAKELNGQIVSVRHLVSR
jgi:hypothetical protein